MKILFPILVLLAIGGSCDTKEYPQEQEWREKLEDTHKMKQEKKKDPRHFDKEQEQDQDYREVRIEKTEE